MAIPKKPKERKNPLDGFVKAAQAFPQFIKSIPSLPKGKLFKLTGIFFISICGIYYGLGPKEYLIRER